MTPQVMLNRALYQRPRGCDQIVACLPRMTESYSKSARIASNSTRSRLPGGAKQTLLGTRSMIRKTTFPSMTGTLRGVVREGDYQQDVFPSHTHGDLDHPSGVSDCRSWHYVCQTGDTIGRFRSSGIGTLESVIIEETGSQSACGRTTGTLFFASDTGAKLSPD